MFHHFLQHPLTQQKPTFENGCSNFHNKYLGYGSVDALVQCRSIFVCQKSFLPYDGTNLLRPFYSRINVQRIEVKDLIENSLIERSSRSDNNTSVYLPGYKFGVSS